MRKVLLTVLAAFFSVGLVVSPVWAKTCPKLAKQAKEAIAAGKYDKATVDKANALIAQGEKLHEQGKHDESVKTLNEALALLGQKPAPAK